jgi:hypothetical protein
MMGSMVTGMWPHEDVVAGLLKQAKKYNLTLTEPGADAIYEALSMGEILKLDKAETPEAEKLKILRAATVKAIKDTKDAAVKKELETLLKDVDKKLQADGGVP